MTIADGTRLNSNIKGILRFTNEFGENKEIKDVYYLPESTTNLISIGKVCGAGNKITIVNSKLEVRSKAGKPVLTGVLKGGVFELQMSPIRPDNHLLVSGKNRNWHRILGHTSANILNRIPGIQKQDESSCEVCMKAKLTALPYAKE
jgi:hypothetical protein